MMRFSRGSHGAFLVFSLLLLTAAGVGCQDETGDSGMPTGSSQPAPTTTPTTPTPAAGGGSLRVAQLVADARSVDVVVNGDSLFRSLAFSEVSEYADLDAGEYRIQFFSAGQRSLALAETVVSLGAGEALTVSLVGSGSFDTVVTSDELTVTADRARVRLFNAVPDFPAHFDLRVFNGPILLRDVRFKRASDYVDLIPGIYDLELLRAGTDEVVASTLGESLGSDDAYTIIAVGSLSRGNITLLVVRDSR